jgi:hypothetical protein
VSLREEENALGRRNPVNRGTAREGAEPVEDDEYSRGYEEGARNVLMEVMSFVSKGHTSLEIRYLVETRLAHMGEETRERRQSRTLSAPRRIPLESLLPQKPHRESSIPRDEAAPLIQPGFSYLFLQGARSQSRQFLGSMLSHGLPVVAITRLSQELVQYSPRGKLLVLHIDSRGGDDGNDDTLVGVRHVGADINKLTGILVRFHERMGDQVGIYMESFEYLKSEYSFEVAIRLVHWLNTMTQKGDGVLAVSADPESMDKQQLSDLRRDFNIEKSGP